MAPRFCYLPSRSLLDCGARALDLRVHVLAQSTQLVFQHGRVVIDHTVQAALQEVRRPRRTLERVLDLRSRACFPLSASLGC